MFDRRRMNSLRDSLKLNQDKLKQLEVEPLGQQHTESVCTACTLSGCSQQKNRSALLRKEYLLEEQEDIQRFLEAYDDKGDKKRKSPSRLDGPALRHRGLASATATVPFTCSENSEIQWWTPWTRLPTRRSRSLIQCHLPGVPVAVLSQVLTCECGCKYMYSHMKIHK